MTRSTRNIASLLLAASIGFSALGASPVGAASGNDDTTPGGSFDPSTCQVPTGSTDISSFLPTANAGGFKADTKGNIFITNPGSGGREMWDRIFSYLGEDLANDFIDDLNATQERAESRFDKKGKGDTSSTADNKHFKTEQVKNGFAVRSTSGGGVVGVYESEKKANAVANALEEEMKEKTEQTNNSGDPCIVIYDFSSEHRHW